MPRFISAHFRSIRTMCLAFVAYGSLASAAIISQIVPSPDTLDAAAKWPITLALIALCAWSLWLAFKQNDKAIQAHIDVANALKEMSILLAQRPCVRDRHND